MTAEDHCLLLLARSAICKEPPPDLPEDANLLTVLALANRCRMGVLIADAMLRIPDLPQSMRNEAQNALYKARYTEAIRHYELAALEAGFAKHHVHYCLLKGAVWQQLYPAPYLREMNDVDVLVRLEQWTTACDIFIEHGFKLVTHRDNELHATFDKDAVRVELHRHLFSNNHSKYMPASFQTWDTLVPDGAPCRWVMTPTDEYLYLFIHMEKHIGIGRFSPRMLIDAYVLRHTGRPVDRDLLVRHAKAVKLYGFVENMEALSEAIITGCALSEMRAGMLAHLMSLAYLTFDEYEYRVARRWLRLNCTPVGMRRQLFAPKSFLLARYDGVALWRARCKWILDAKYNFTFYIHQYIGYIFRLPLERRRALNRGQASLYRMPPPADHKA